MVVGLCTAMGAGLCTESVAGLCIALSMFYVQRAGLHMYSIGTVICSLLIIEWNRLVAL